MAVVGIAGLLAGCPFLFPSLGPTAYLVAESPALHRSKIYNVLAAHLIGLGVGFLVVFLVGAYNDPVVLTQKQITLARVLAALVGLGLTIAAAFLLRASHPPAGATTLLVALGSIKTVEDITDFVIGLVLLAIVGEVLRRMRLSTAPLPTEMA